MRKADAFSSRSMIVVFASSPLMVILPVMLDSPLGPIGGYSSTAVNVNVPGSRLIFSSPFAFAVFIAAISAATSRDGMLNTAAWAGTITGAGAAKQQER